MEDGLSANGDNESDESSGYDNTLTEGGGDIPNSTTKMFGSFSRDFEAGDTEDLTHADGLSTDINGANQAMSVTCFFKVENISSFQQLVAKYRAVNGYRQYDLMLDDTGPTNYLQVFLSSDGNTGTSCFGVTDTTDGAWHQGAFVYNDTDIRAYLDGAVDSNGANNPKAFTAGIFNSPCRFAVGSRTDGTTTEQYFDGLIDDVAIFNRELTSVEVADINTNGVVGVGGLPDTGAILRNCIIRNATIM